MNLLRTLSYSLMTAGTAGSLRAVLDRQQWDEANIHTAIMVDWDDVQAVAARMTGDEVWPDPRARTLALLHRYRQAGATHLALPELTLRRLLDQGDLTPEHGADPQRTYLRARHPDLAARVVEELRFRLPHVQVKQGRGRHPLVSFVGHLPTLSEVSLGFDPDQAALARDAGLRPVARPIGYSWVQPEMIDRTLNQAAALGCRLVAVQGNLVPGHEFNIQYTVEAFRRNGLTFAYFHQTRHQKGDWFVAKNLAPEGLVVLAHEFTPQEMLEEDWHTMAHRWANLAVESGVRLCSVRFFRILHAADPLESEAYIHALKHALVDVGFLVDGHPGLADLTPFLPRVSPAVLSAAGVSAAGAAGLAVEDLPLPAWLKLAGVSLAAAGLAALPFVEQSLLRRQSTHSHSHHHLDDPHHHHDHHHSHSHGEHDHSHPHIHDRVARTAYAAKGIALTAAAMFPAAGAASRSGPGRAVLHAAVTAAAGAITLTAATSDVDNVMGVEEYRGAPLDWLVSLTLATLNSKFKTCARDGIQHSTLRVLLPLVILGAVRGDLPARLDREHRHAHTHHLSAFQRWLGDLRLILSLRPLRKWSLLALPGTVAAARWRLGRAAQAADAARLAAVAGQAATLTGFRNAQRPLAATLAGRARGWAIGGAAAAVLWLVSRWWRRG